MAGADLDETAGGLTLVGTPIGNLNDMTPQGLRALRLADVICAEDTRRTRKLLTAFEIHPRRLHSIRAHNEQGESARVVRWIREGRAVAYVTDAGMPSLSDPGERLTRAVLAAGGTVGIAPAADAATAALLLSGIPHRRWSFEGFLPPKGVVRRQRLEAIAAEPRTVVLFEAPHRLQRTLDDLVEHVGPDRSAAVCNDLTKLFERVWRGPIGAVATQLGAVEPKGEFVIVISADGLPGLPQRREGS